MDGAIGGPAWDGEPNCGCEVRLMSEDDIALYVQPNDFILRIIASLIRTSRLPSNSKLLNTLLAMLKKALE